MTANIIGIALGLALATGALWLMAGFARRVRRGVTIAQIARVASAICLVALSAGIFVGVANNQPPHPFFNRAAPVPASTLVFYQTPNFAGNPETSPTLLAINGQTGKTTWRRTLPSVDMVTTQVGATIYALAPSLPGQNTLTALRAADGATLWNRSITAAAIIHLPVVIGDTLYVSAWMHDEAGATTGAVPELRLLALRAADGAILWSIPLLFDGSYPMGPSLYAAGDVLIVQYDRSGLQAISLRSHTILWQGAFEPTFSGLLVTGPSLLYELGTAGPLIARSVRTGVIVWRFGNHDSFLHDAVVVGNQLFVTAQKYGTNAHSDQLSPETLYALDAATGRLQWSFATQSHNAGTVLAWNTNVFINADDGVYLLRASDGAIQWGSDGHGSLFSHVFGIPAVVGPAMYVLTMPTLPSEDLVSFNGQSKAQMYLYAVNARDGSVDWAVALGPVITLYPHLVL